MPRKSSRLPRSANKIKLCPGIKKKLHWKLWEIVCTGHCSLFYILQQKNGVENCVRARKLPLTLAVNASLIKCPAPKHRYSSLLLDETTPRAADVCVLVCVCVPKPPPYLFALWLILWLKVWNLEFTWISSRRPSEVSLFVARILEMPNILYIQQF